MKRLLYVVLGLGLAPAVVTAEDSVSRAFSQKLAEMAVPSLESLASAAGEVTANLMRQHVPSLNWPPAALPRRAPQQQPRVDYKMTVVRPNPADVPRMRIGRPDPGIDYKILTPRDDQRTRSPARTPRER